MLKQKKFYFDDLNFQIDLNTKNFQMKSEIQ